MPLLIDTYGLAAGALAADWYDDLRAEQEVRGRFVADPTEIGDRGAEQLATWSVARTWVSPDDWSNVIPAAQGGLQRRLADVARETIMNASIRDTEAEGWQRVARPGACSFCVMVASRGVVYRESSARFASHDHCFCTAVPAGGGFPVPVKPYTPSARNITDADRGRVREYLRTHPTT